MEKREDELAKVLDILVINEKTIGYCLQTKGTDGEKGDMS